MSVRAGGGQRERRPHKQTGALALSPLPRQPPRKQPPRKQAPRSPSAVAHLTPDSCARLGQCPARQSGAAAARGPPLGYYSASGRLGCRPAWGDTSKGVRGQHGGAPLLLPLLLCSGDVGTACVRCLLRLWPGQLLPPTPPPHATHRQWHSIASKGHIALPVATHISQGAGGGERHCVKGGLAQHAHCPARHHVLAAQHLRRRAGRAGGWWSCGRGGGQARGRRGRALEGIKASSPRARLQQRRLARAVGADQQAGRAARQGDAHVADHWCAVWQGAAIWRGGVGGGVRPRVLSSLWGRAHSTTAAHTEPHNQLAPPHQCQGRRMRGGVWPQPPPRRPVLPPRVGVQWRRASPPRCRPFAAAAMPLGWIPRLAWPRDPLMAAPSAAWRPAGPRPSGASLKPAPASHPCPSCGLHSGADTSSVNVSGREAAHWCKNVGETSDIWGSRALCCRRPRQHAMWLVAQERAQQVGK